ncbi:45668_t:CDS:2 [Gigaspora margarita]|uniref:45668_t:CDS:1 n=1 Tax=Gigaspora margarita TaxID=4874 RepID=A0ABN7V8P1_GIGMA|nr:45668_t:CDS:2 [Gigaspora margarita]
MKRIGCPFTISVNYHNHIKKFAITKSNLEHNYDNCIDATKFSTVAQKLDKDGLGLNEIELLLKTLCDDKSIVDNIVLKDALNNK